MFVTIPLKLAPLLSLLMMVPAPFNVMALVEVNAVLPVMVKVPTLKAKAVPVPKLPSLATLKIPPLILVVPV